MFSIIMIRKIIKKESETLRRVCSHVDNFNKVQNVIDDLIDTI